MPIPFYVILAAIVGMNVLATARLAKSSRYDVRQKWLQAGLIWLVPLLGASTVWSLLRDEGRLHVTHDDVGPGTDGDCGVSVSIDSHGDGCGDGAGGDGGGGD